MRSESLFSLGESQHTLAPTQQQGQNFDEIITHSKHDQGYLVHSGNGLGVDSYINAPSKVVSLRR